MLLEAGADPEAAQGSGFPYNPLKAKKGTLFIPRLLPGVDYTLVPFLALGSYSSYVHLRGTYFFYLGSYSSYVHPKKYLLLLLQSSVMTCFLGCPVVPLFPFWGV